MREQTQNEFKTDQGRRSTLMEKSRQGVEKREILPRRITWSVAEEINAPQNTDMEC
jgi:hypothetical protein